ncbi:MAG TPA: nucleotidyltransferase family protein [Bryobacteraceae bacterium]|nr:nucleotidyltransferase family protein [Bryobacteraceae bacterium]
MIPQRRTAAVILAAGESRRMGRPKAFLPFRGGTFLSNIAGTLRQRCAPVVAVFGFDAARLMPLSAAAGIEAVENPDHALGMLTSLQAGLRTVGSTPDSVLFTLVDHPVISLATVDALLASKAPIAIPRFGGKRGHPVSIRREIVREFLEEPVESKVRDVIDRHAAEIDYIEVDDPGISDDIDDPALYEQLLARDAARRHEVLR